MQRVGLAGISSEFGGISLTGISRELAGIGCVTLFDRVSSGWEKVVQFVLTWSPNRYIRLILQTMDTFTPLRTHPPRGATTSRRNIDGK